MASLAVETCAYRPFPAASRKTDMKPDARRSGLSEDRREGDAGIFHGLLYDRRRLAIEELTEKLVDGRVLV